MENREILYIETLSNRDHRTLFTESEIETALLTFMSKEEAKMMAYEMVEGPIVLGRPSFFAEHLLELLSNISPDVARRVRIARGL